MNTLATLVSQQIWPQLHALTLTRPEQLLILHSPNPKHGTGPALRLQNALHRWKEDLGLDWVPRSVELREISDHNLADIQSTLSALPLKPDLLHLTGGNKLMGFAAFEWARHSLTPVLYRERETGFVQINFTPGGMSQTLRHADPAPLSALDPSETVRCQLTEGQIDRPGELLVLSKLGHAKGIKELDKFFKRGSDCRNWMTILGQADEDVKAGDLLEMQCAAALLKLGIPMVSRSLRLKAAETESQPNSEPFQEVDLLFHHHGRLWLVDCKDRNEYSQYRDTGYKALMEDVMGARALGGLDARILCVRKARFTPGQELFARDFGIQYISRHNLIPELDALLHVH